MTVVNGYLTVEELRNQLSDAGVNADLGQIERAIEATSRAIEDYAGRRFWKDATPTVRRYRPRDPGAVLVNDSTGDGSYATTWTLDTDFILEPLDADQADVTAYAWWQLTAIGDKAFPVGGRRPGLRVTATHGWSAIPAGVHQAAIIKATGLRNRVNAVWGVANFGEYGAIRITRKDVDVVDLLNPFCRITKADT
jgi:hypothetical protein